MEALGGHLGPLVVTNVPDSVVLTAVAVDSYAGMRDLAEHLSVSGHARVTYLAGPPGSWSNNERSRALRDSPFGTTLREVPCGERLDDGYATAERARSSGGDALVCFNDVVALGLMARLRELGVRVGEDVSVTGFDDVPLARMWSPSLTTVATPQVELGTMAWRALRSHLQGEPVARRVDLLPTLRIRESTMGPAGGGWERSA
jgi:LacI family transcriptional regulator